jgi:hypothetical protein
MRKSPVAPIPHCVSGVLSQADTHTGFTCGDDDGGWPPHWRHRLARRHRLAAAKRVVAVVHLAWPKTARRRVVAMMAAAGGWERRTFCLAMQMLDQVKVNGDQKVLKAACLYAAILYLCL